MKILVLNCGSSSLKYQLIDMTDEKVLAKGNYERIGQKDSFLTHKVNGEKYVIEQDVENHDEAIRIVMDQFINESYGILSSLDEIDGIGHRIVHGGEKFKKSVVVTDEVIEGIRECADLAPVHNPGAISGIEACRRLMPNKKMVCVFDTAFHQTIPEERYLFPIPYEYYEKYKIRKYGFHGTSHFYVSRRVAEILGKPVEELKTIVCHIGQGASICAVQNGKSVDTSMGLSPLGGIMMCARSGDLDPSIVTFLMKKEGLSPDNMDKILNKQSGIFGISGVAPDIRDIEKAKLEGNKRAELALKAYDFNIAQYIAKYAVSMGGVDVIAFTAGVGENQKGRRKGICKYLKFLGVEIDDNRNDTRGEDAEISSDNSKIKVFVVPTNEELVIARDTKNLI